MHATTDTAAARGSSSARRWPGLAWVIPGAPLVCVGAKSRGLCAATFVGVVVVLAGLAANFTPAGWVALAVLPLALQVCGVVAARRALPGRGEPAATGVLFGLVLLQFGSWGVAGAVTPRPFLVAGASMSPTLRSGDLVWVDRQTLYWRAPAVGDVVVFQHRDWTMVKRVVATAPATVQFSAGRMEVDGLRVNEPYLPRRHERPTCGPHRVAAGQVFVLGDNRFASLGSCDWGPIDLTSVQGRVAYTTPPWLTALVEDDDDF